MELIVSAINTATHKIYANWSVFESGFATRAPNFTAELKMETFKGIFPGGHFCQNSIFAMDTHI